MTSESSEYGSPWYQNFWPWFIVILLGVSVIGSLATVFIAYRYRDVDVRVRPPAASSPPAESFGPPSPSTPSTPAASSAPDARNSGP